MMASATNLSLAISGCLEHTHFEAHSKKMVSLEQVHSLGLRESATRPTKSNGGTLMEFACCATML